jgi:glycosyltransferase involved in cell wall biosynthesis
LHGYGSTNFGRIAAKIINKKSIVHEHFVDPNLPLYQIPFDFMLSRSTNYGIAVSDSVNEFMVKKRFLPKHQVQTIFNGAPLDLYQPREEEIVRRERKAWGIPREHKIVATIGRIDEQKGNKYLIDAAVELLKRGYKITFMVIGDGPLLNELRDRCQKRQIYKHFVFTGYQKNIPLIQSIIDIQVFPSLWEGTPLTLFEAMSMGKAIVSTTVDGLGEVLTHDVNALLVAPRTTHELCQAIERLYLDPKLSQALAHKARMDSAQFDIQKSVDKMQHIYEQLISKS